MKCVICELEIDLFDDECGYYIEGDKVYCEKCYAQKRYYELRSQNKHHAWEATNKAFIQSIDRVEDEKARKKLYRTWLRKIPVAHESFFKDQEYVKKVKEQYWKHRKWVWHNVDTQDEADKIVKEKLGVK